MNLRIVKLFSILVASGEGKRCAELRSRLTQNLLRHDSELDIPRVEIYKNGYVDPKLKKASVRVGAELAQDINTVFKGISKHYFSSDIPRNNAESN